MQTINSQCTRLKWDLCLGGGSTERITGDIPYLSERLQIQRKDQNQQSADPTNKYVPCSLKPDEAYHVSFHLLAENQPSRQDKILAVNFSADHQ